MCGWSQTIADACSDRLGTFRRWIGVSTLRSIDVDGISDELTVEPLNRESKMSIHNKPLEPLIKLHFVELILRVLYRLRSQAEQSPFDSATYSYAAPLITHIISTSGKHAADADEALEQLSLALDFIRFHCSECKLPRP